MLPSPTRLHNFENGLSGNHSVHSSGGITWLFILLDFSFSYALFIGVGFFHSVCMPACVRSCACVRLREPIRHHLLIKITTLPKLLETFVLCKEMTSLPTEWFFPFQEGEFTKLYSGLLGQFHNHQLHALIKEKQKPVTPLGNWFRR